MDHSYDGKKFKGRVDFEVYKLGTPKVEDKLWKMAESGFHEILTLYFNFGLSLPMHLFHRAIFQLLECGIAQL